VLMAISFRHGNQKYSGITAREPRPG
jgi:hypothetical protein